MNLLRWIPFSVLGAVAAMAADGVALVRLGDTWRWTRARAEASTPPEAWRGAGYDDSSWAHSPSGFTFDYYGYEASVVSDVPRDYSGLYLRARFDVPELEHLAWLTLRMDWNGGFVAYLNGREIARRNLGGTAGGDWMPAGAGAQPRSRGVPEEIEVSEYIPWLRSHDNVLAVQWHNSLPLGYGVGLVPELLANFTRGPFVQATTSASQRIAWKTRQPTRGGVEFGLTPALGARVEVPTASTNQVVTLDGLRPDTRYFYRVVAEAEGRIGRSPLTSFRTFRERGPFRFLVTADVGLGTAAQQAVARVMRDANPDLVVINGDLVYPGYQSGLADLKFFSLYQPQMQSVPYFASAGNHEVQHGNSQAYFADFYLPTNGVPSALHAADETGPEHFYSFDHGDAHFVVLYAPLQMGTAALRSDSAQFRWLEQNLAQSEKPWKFLFLHLPLASSGPHGNDDYNYNQVRDTDELSALLLPLARRYGAQVIFSAHDHTYERFLPAGGVHRIVTGGGGGTLYHPTVMEPGSVQFASQWHITIAEMSESVLTLTAVDWTGRILDQSFVGRVPPSADVHAATWHTPQIERTALNDGDGNVPGQTFDLIGVPLTSVGGHFSNLGRLWVNYDHRFLYLGLERVALSPDQDVILFIEAPGDKAVSRTNLVGLGNGRLDPDGEGVDGLDFLENVRFTGFAPSVAAVVGDEFADTTVRGFRRSSPTAPPRTAPSPAGVSLAAGQGVFRLDETFSTIQGARLQQFNQSPQLAPARHEQNADFIELAVPMAELGQPFDSEIRLAAVVASAHLPDPTLPARSLDTAFLGARLTAAADGGYEISPLRFQVGPDLDADDDGLSVSEERALGLDPLAPDTDGDSLPDGWEVRHQLNPNSPAGPDGAAGDPDGDRMANLAEYRAGTHPRDPSSALRLTAHLAPNAQLILEWESVIERTYWLEESRLNGEPFAPVTGVSQPILGSGENEMKAVPLTAPHGGSARLFRVRVELE